MASIDDVDERAGSTGRPEQHPQRPVPGGLLIGHVLGVPIYLAPTWILIAVLITVVVARRVEAEIAGIGALRYVVAFGFAVLLYASVLIHEIGHTLTAVRLGHPVRRITLHFLGGASELESEPRTPGREFLIAVAGPVLSLLLGLGTLVIARSMGAGTVPGFLMLELAVANLAVGVLNLLPGLPLDGGRLVAAAVWKLSGRRLTGIVVAAHAGRALAVVVLVLPLLWGIAVSSSVPVGLVLWAAVVASFLWVGAGQTLASARIRARIPEVSARRLARRAVPVEAALPLSEALRRLREADAAAMVVVDSTGRPTGLVDEAAVGRTPEQRRPWVSAGDVARRLDNQRVLTVDLAGDALVEAMARFPSTEYLVLDAAGLVYGVLSTADVERAVTAR